MRQSLLGEPRTQNQNRSTPDTAMPLGQKPPIRSRNVTFQSNLLLQL
jgi:hypothetical protein